MPAGGSRGPARAGQDDEWGTEYDRPRTADGLTDLFKTALEDFHEDIDVETALKGLDLEKLDDRIPGLKVQLMPHQVLGVHWMVQQEKKATCQGGILGDQMGLGKTVQAIATMVKNRSTDRKVKTTLIVLPLPLVQQWKAEIESKSDLSVLIYHGPNRAKSVNMLKMVDCVITTYSILTNEGSDLLVSRLAAEELRAVHC
jgi:SNF2 family DNA or RNA helicase